nr:c-type cytochrome biogenesis protein CcmI [Neptunicella marina]
MVLVVAAALFILLPWIRASKNLEIKAASQRDMNIGLTRQRLDEIEQERAQHIISDDAAEQAKQEVQLALVEETGEQGTLTSSLSRGWLGISFVIALMITGGVYWHVSQLNKLHHWQHAIDTFPQLAKRAVIEADATVTPQELSDLALGLRTSLQKKPDDAIAWLLLGRVYNAIGYIEPAINAFERSLKIDPAHLSTKVSLSQSLLMTGDASQLKKARSLLVEVLRQQPDDTDALGLLAIVASQLEDNQLAIQTFKILQSKIDPADPMYASIGQQLNKLNDTETSLTGFTVSVNVADDIKHKIPTNGYLVVFAKDAAKNAKPMPAAAITQSLKNWPVTLDLTNKNAMLANYSLTNLSHVTLTARISRSQNVMPSVGDMQGKIEAEVVQGQLLPVSIVIDQEITQ